MDIIYSVGVTNRFELFLEEEENPLENLRIQEKAKKSRKKDKSEKEKFDSNCEKEADNYNKTKEGTNAENARANTDKECVKRNVKFAIDLREERHKRPNATECAKSTNQYAKEQKFIHEQNSINGQGDGNDGDTKTRPRTRFRIIRRSSYIRGGGNYRSQYGFKNMYDNELKENNDAESSENLDICQLYTSLQPRKANLNQETSPKCDKPDIADDEGNVDETGADGDADLQDSTDVETKECTLDEYYARRGKREKPMYNLRKAGEGEDLSQWKKMYELTKKRDEVDFQSFRDNDITMYPQRARRQKQFVDIDINFADSPRRGRGWGPVKNSDVMGRGRRMSERNELRERVSHQTAPMVDNEAEFPTLA